MTPVDAVTLSVAEGLVLQSLSPCLTEVLQFVEERAGLLGQEAQHSRHSPYGEPETPATLWSGGLA